MTSAWQASSVDCARTCAINYFYGTLALGSATDLTIQVNGLPDANDPPPLLSNPTSWKMVTVGVGDTGSERCVKLGADGICRMFLNINFDVSSHLRINSSNT